MVLTLSKVVMAKEFESKVRGSDIWDVQRDCTDEVSPSGEHDGE
jgi:hypothetical protein